ncbi:hypothetical protein [Pedobacter frigoris]|uniref:Dual-action HEIGH metallo-peptidase n=1 Tax=Pedobacter frigoris TaxID=2571272 RepID=A0A4U1CTT7_9SPHI|nr:hypothetical protein [Pedobacter frigoris]TKC09389.1 hypothetical protein FA047_04650 [Pedobacter frigoris]
MKKTIIPILAVKLMCCSLFFTACKKPVTNQEEASSRKPPGEKSTLSSPVTNSRNLNVIYFIPNDNPALANYKTRISDLLFNFQDFVAGEMDRNGYGTKTFGLSINDTTGNVNIITIMGQYGQANYGYSTSGSTVLTEVNAYKATHASEFSSQHSLIIMPLRTDGGSTPFYGVGRNCFAVDYNGLDVANLATTTSNLMAGMLHELGHGLGLPHNKQRVSQAGTLGTSLMGAGNTTYGRSATFMTEADCAVLNTCEVFQPTTSATFYGAVTTTLKTYGNPNPYDGNIYVRGKFTSSSPVTNVLYFLDPNVNNEGTGVNKDYNANAFRSSVTPTDSFNVALPVGDLQVKGNTPYELKIKLVCQNGTVVTYTYNFSFVSDVPQFPNSIQFYQHCSYGGWTATLPIGTYTQSQMGTLGLVNNDLSSFKIPYGLKVTIYKDDNFGGASAVYTGGNSCLSGGFNDVVSSVKVAYN